jgi:hypothetical protein
MGARTRVENRSSTNGLRVGVVYLSEDRCHTVGMGSGQRWTRERLQDALVRAAAEGHELQPELVRVKVTKNGYGRAARCSCGWQSTPKTKPIKAFSAGWFHIGEVLGDALYEDWAGGVGASPDVPERSTVPTEEGAVSGEGEPSSDASSFTRATVAAP